MGSVLGSPKSKEEREMALNKAKDIASSAPVVIFRYYLSSALHAALNFSILLVFLLLDNLIIMLQFVHCCIWNGKLAAKVRSKMFIIDLQCEFLIDAVISLYLVVCKTYCGYCKRVKELLIQLGVAYKVIELNEESDGGDIQAALAEWTGQRTVPNVFIGGKHIGGCDTVLAKYQAGQLTPLLNDAGAIANKQ
ncbi:glutaredoxin [Senna tora]|uniref:Glutaredoxin n=1 Tax=Senna tora TaxID=362788 RepID=A0A834X5P8_9FABA|nr:glutaredoxin [Senna tora]